VFGYQKAAKTDWFADEMARFHNSEEKMVMIFI
jgi:hypothetical protein